MRRTLAIGVVATSVLAAMISVAPHTASTQGLTLPTARESYIPTLGDIMGATQLRHFKLWYAGKLYNWDLAAYELQQIRASFDTAVTLYPGIPVADMTVMAKPVLDLNEAIKQKDSVKFARAFDEMTTSCNACHQAIGRGFIVVQVPTASPFSNQSFAPRNTP